MNIQIDKGIPVPQSSKAPKWGPVLKEMEVGDSFLLTEKMGNPTNMKSNIWRTAKGLGYRLSSRATDDGVRVWRVE
jgi:hypothetical protein